MPLYRWFLRSLSLLSVAVHLDRLADFFRVYRFRLKGEDWRVPHEDFHRTRTALRAMGVVRRAGVSTLMILIDPCKEQGAVVHDNNVLRLIRLK